MLIDPTTSNLLSRPTDVRLRPVLVWFPADFLTFFTVITVDLGAVCC